LEGIYCYKLNVNTKTYDLSEVSSWGDTFGIMSLIGLFISLFLSGCFFTFFVSVRSKYARNINPNTFTFKRMKNISILALGMSVYIIIISCLLFYISIVPDMNENYNNLDSNRVRKANVFLEGAWAYELLWAVGIIWFFISLLIFVQSKRITEEMNAVSSQNYDMNERLEHGEIGIDLEFINASNSNYKK